MSAAQQLDVNEVMRGIRSRLAASTPTNSLSSSWQHVQRLFDELRNVSEMGGHLPEMKRLGQVGKTAVAPFAKAVLRVAQIFTREQRQFNSATIRSLELLAAVTQAELATELPRRLTQWSQDLHAAMDSIRRAAEVQSANALRGLEDLRHVVQETEVRFGTAIANESARRDETTATLKGAIAEVQSAGQATHDEINELRVGLRLQEQRLTALLQQGIQAPTEVKDREVEHMYDMLYLGLENRFRGSEFEIAKRLEFYLPLIRATGAGTAGKPVLDIGCGRGEMLSLLRDEGLSARGIDLNRAMVELCKQRGLDAEAIDLRKYLSTLPDHSLGAITAFHVVEHLPLETLITLLDETVRVLAPGGIAIFETPNPKNVLVGASTFYIDPTHRNPVYPDTLRYFAEARGLERIEIRPLHAADPVEHVQDNSAIAQRFNAYFYGPQDFAVIAYRGDQD